MILVIFTLQQEAAPSLGLLLLTNGTQIRSLTLA